MPDLPDAVVGVDGDADAALAPTACPTTCRTRCRDLPDDYRAAVVLCDVVGFDYAEIAETLDIPLGTVRSRIHRGRAQLRKALA